MKQLSKNDTQRFLQDVAELEAKAFTLEQLAEECNEEISARIRNIEYEVKKATKNYKFKEQNAQDHEQKVNEQRVFLSEQQDQLKKLKRECNTLDENNFDDKQIVINDSNKSKVLKAQTAGCGIGCLATVVLYLSIVIILAILSTLPNLNLLDGLLGELLSMFTLPLLIILAVILCTIGAKKGGKLSRKKVYYKQRKDELEKEIEQCKEQIFQCEEALQNKENNWHQAQKEYLNEEAQLQKLRQEKAMLDQQLHLAEQQKTMSQESAKTIKENLARIYEASDLIPPDYREMDCVLAFQQIFRNDLADTMREAVMIYEQRVFRQEVIRGMDRIYHKLEDLDSSMYYLKHTLTGIRDNISMMSQDVFKIAEKMDQISQQMSDNSQLQSNLLRETQASRYAIDAIKQSQLQCEKYLEKAKESSERMEKKMDN